MKAYRYAQAEAGQQLHLVEEFALGSVGRIALCGRTPKKHWRMTINVPLGQACKNCLRKLDKRNEAKQ